MSLDGVAKLKQAAAGNGPLCSVCWVQTGWALVSGVPARAFVSHGHHGRAVLQGTPGLCIMLVSTFSPLLLHEVRNFVVKLSRFGSVPATPGTRN